MFSCSLNDNTSLVLKLFTHYLKGVTLTENDLNGIFLFFFMIDVRCVCAEKYMYIFFYLRIISDALYKWMTFFYHTYLLCFRFVIVDMSLLNKKPTLII